MRASEGGRDSNRRLWPSLPACGRDSLLGPSLPSADLCARPVRRSVPRAAPSAAAELLQALSPGGSSSLLLLQGHRLGRRRPSLGLQRGRAPGSLGTGFPGVAPRGCRGRVLHKHRQPAAHWAPRASVGGQFQHRGGGIGVGSPPSGATLQPSTRRYPPAGLSPANGEPAPGRRTGLLSISFIYHVPVCTGHVGRGAPLSQSAWVQGGGGRYNPVGGALLGNVSKLRRPRLRESGRAS